MTDYKQTEIDFTVHTQENNPESETHLLENKMKFSKQSKTVFDLMMAGKRLTSRSAMIEHHIGHLARRIKDLKDAPNNIPVIDEWVKDADGTTQVKEWFMTPENIAKLKLKIIN